MQLGIKAAHKPVRGYYTALAEFEKHGIVKETSVRNAFQEVLTTYARKLKWSFIEEYGVTLANKNKGSVDGALLDPFSIVMGYWEAKDSNVDLAKEVKKKFDIGYPKSNILFQEPRRIPPEAFDYRLGNRSALDWIIDQYQVSTDKRSGLTRMIDHSNDPNREDDPPTSSRFSSESCPLVSWFPN